MTTSPKLSCDGCAMCCNLLAVEDLPEPKPRCVTCKFVVETGPRRSGCGIYNSRPQSCQVFECVWLTSQSGNAPWPKKMRPDLCGVMFASSTDENTLVAHAQDERWFKEGIAVKWITRWLHAGLNVMLVCKDRRKALISRVNVRVDKARQQV